MSNVIPLKKEKAQTLDSLIEDNYNMNKASLANELLENYKKDPTNPQLANGLGMVLFSDFYQGLPKEELVNKIEEATSKLAPHSISQAAEGFIKNKEECYNRIKDKLYSEYFDFTNKTIEGGINELKKQLKEKKIPQEKQKELIEMAAYSLVGNLVSTSKLNPKGESELAKLYQELIQLKESPEKAVEASKLMYLKKHGMPPYISHALEGNAKLLYAIKGREIGMKLVKEKDGKYVIDESKFKEAFENYNSGLGILQFQRHLAESEEKIKEELTKQKQAG